MGSAVLDLPLSGPSALRMCARNVFEVSYTANR